MINANDHLEAADVVRQIRREIGTVSVQAVYNVLEALGRPGLVRRIEPPGRPALFEARVGDNHHHLICRQCAAITNLDCAVDDVPCLHPSDDHNFLIDEAEVTWYGLCVACQQGRNGPL